MTGLSALALYASGCGTCGAEITFPEDSSHQATITWSGKADGAVAVIYGDDGRTAAATSDGRSHSATLWGLPSLAEITYQITDGGEAVCEDVFTARGVSSELPDLAVPVHEPGLTAGWQYIAGVAMGEGRTLFMLDRQGRWVWSSRHSAERTVSAVAIDGDALLYNQFDIDRSNDVGEVTRQPLFADEDAATSTRTEGAHHTFDLLPDGTLAFPSADVRLWTDPETEADVSVVGDRILEVSPDGEVRELWSLWDHETPQKHDAWDSGFYDGLGQDWSHANALRYDAGRDSYLVSLGHLNTIYEIDRGTGDVLMRITQDWVAEGDPVFNFQHDTGWGPDGTLLLLSYPETGSAVAIEYEVDADNETLRAVWSYERQGGTTLLGQVRRLDNGNTLINFGGIGEIREVTPAGEIAWQLNAALGTWFGNSVLLDAFPETP